jgi:hypothetical protein
MSENQQPSHDSLAEVIEAFQRMAVPDRPADAAVLARLGVDQCEPARPILNPAPLRKNAYVLRLVVPSAAAALLLAGVLALSLLNGTAPIAVADVVKAAVQHKLVRYQEQQTTDTREHAGTRLDSTVYADLTAPRLRSESRVAHADGEAVHVSVQDGASHLMTNSRDKTALLLPTPKDFKSFCCSLEEFEKHQGVTQVKDTLGGLATVKYHFQEGNQRSSLWVDAKTKLPLRMEQELTWPGPDVTRQRFVWTDFQWDPELPQGFSSPAELFSTRPPLGYALDDQTRAKKRK